MRRCLKCHHVCSDKKMASAHVCKNCRRINQTKSNKDREAIKAAKKIEDFIKKRKERNNHLHKLHTAALRKNPSTVATVVTEMIRLFGGIDEFCEAWKESMDESIANMPGSTLVTRHFNTIVKLMEITTKIELEKGKEEKKKDE